MSQVFLFAHRPNIVIDFCDEFGYVHTVSSTMRDCSCDKDVIATKVLSFRDNDLYREWRGPGGTQLSLRDAVGVLRLQRHAPCSQTAAACSPPTSASRGPTTCAARSATRKHTTASPRPAPRGRGGVVDGLASRYPEPGLCATPLSNKVESRPMPINVSKSLPLSLLKTPVPWRRVVFDAREVRGMLSRNTASRNVTVHRSGASGRGL